jgi:hypothetical protein
MPRRLAGRKVDREFVVSAAEVLHEGATGDDHMRVAMNTSEPWAKQSTRAPCTVRSPTPTFWVDGRGY